MGAWLLGRTRVLGTVREARKVGQQGWNGPPAGIGMTAVMLPSGPVREGVST